MSGCLRPAQCSPYQRGSRRHSQGSELTWLDAFRRVRWAIQGSYFASRILADDQTGIADDPEHNKDAIATARRRLEECAPTPAP